MYIRSILLDTFVRCNRERTAARGVRFISLFEHAIQIALLSTFAFHQTNKSLLDIPTRFYLQQFTNVSFRYLCTRSWNSLAVFVSKIFSFAFKLGSPNNKLTHSLLRHLRRINELTRLRGQQADI